jgi:hypothetical protein
MPTRLLQYGRLFNLQGELVLHLRAGDFGYLDHPFGPDTYGWDSEAER